MLKGCFSIVIAMFAVLAVSCAQTRLVKQPVTQIEPYCGGARPTAEMEADAQKPRPYVFQTIILISAGKIDSAKTDESGIFAKKLKPGTYKLYEAWRYYKKAPGGGSLSDFNQECLATEWAREFGVLKVSSNDHLLETLSAITIYCDHRLPCLAREAEPPQ